MIVDQLKEPPGHKVQEGCHDDEEHQQEKSLQHARNIHSYFSIF